MSNEKLKIMDKVAKLLNLASGTNHEDEANTAKRMAAELMAKHSISEIELPSNDKFKEVVIPLTRKNHVQYNSTLIQLLSEYCGVAYVQRSGGYSAASHIFIGRTCDVEAFDYIHNIVLSQRKAAYDKWAKDFKAIQGRSPKDKEWTRWYMGFAFGVQEKLNTLKAMENEIIVERGLVPVSLSEQALAWYKEFTEVKNGQGKPVKYNKDGFEAGRNANLNKGVTVQGSPLKITAK
jgi:hypothetical protein